MVGTLTIEFSNLTEAPDKIILNKHFGKDIHTYIYIIHDCFSDILNNKDISDNNLETSLINILKETGFDISDSRFPYTYHHDYYRLNIAHNYDLSRSDCAKILSESSKSEKQEYYSACYFAILYLIKEQPEFVTNDIVNLLKKFKKNSIYTDNE